MRVISGFILYHPAWLGGPKARGYYHSGATVESDIHAIEHNNLKAWQEDTFLQSCRDIGRTLLTHQSCGLDAVGEGPDLLGAEQRLSLVPLVALEDGVARLLADGAVARPQEHLVHRLHRRAERLLSEV